MGEDAARDVVAVKPSAAAVPLNPIYTRFPQSTLLCARAGSRRCTGTPDACRPHRWGSAPHGHAPSGVWSRWSPALLAHLARLLHFSAGLQLRGHQTFSRLESELFFSPNSCKELCLSFSPFLFTRCHQDAL